MHAGKPTTPVDRQTPVKILPCPKLCLWVIKMAKIIMLQECIQVGCVPPTSVAVSPAMHAPCHACPPVTHVPCHANPCHAYPSVTHALLPCMLPLPHMPPNAYLTYHRACPP